MTGPRVALLIALAAAGPVAAQQPIADAGRAQAQLIAQTIDTDGDGLIQLEEMAYFAATVFDVLDLDGNDEMTRDEKASFRFGMTDLADFRGRRQAYDTAQAILFDIFDRDNDGVISRGEHENGFDRAFAFADLDGDGVLTMREYGEGFIFNIAMRNALGG